MSEFFIGQKVVCVDDSPRRKKNTVVNVRRGEVYVIRWLGEWRFAEVGIRAAVRLDGVVRPTAYPHIRDNDVPFALDRFRPLIEDKTEDSAIVKWARRLCVEAEKSEPLRVPTGWAR